MTRIPIQLLMRRITWLTRRSTLLCLTMAIACQTVAQPPPGGTTADQAPQQSIPLIGATGERLPPAHELLRLIEMRTSTVKTLQAKLVYDRTQQLVGDRQRRFGTLVYEKGPPAGFAVHFDRLLVDRRMDHDDRWYIFDGQWLAERYDDQKLFIKRQVIPPHSTDDDHAPPDPLALGAGPFALPIGLKREQIVKRFDVSLTPPADDDSPFHLHLVPKPDHPSEFTEIDLWYERKRLLPTRVRTIDDSENETVVALSQFRVNEQADADTINTSPPTEPGWRIEVKPWQDSPRTDP